MFTGLVQAIGAVEEITPLETGARFTVRAPGLPETALGDSVAVNGCCLTVVERTGDFLRFDLLAETLRRTNLGGLAPGARVNLELALRAGDRLGGHFVQGHVDCVAEVTALEQVGEDHRLEIALPPGYAKYLVEKGSIAVDGISLTVASVSETRFTLWIIPHTWTHTALGDRPCGAQINLEFDMLAKYVERLLQR